MQPTTLDVNASDIITAQSAEDIVTEIDADIETCIALVDAVQFRSEADEMDYAVAVITEWLAAQKFDSSAQRFILTNEVSDVSNKSYLCEECFVTTEAIVSGQQTFGADHTALTVEVDESDGEYVDDPRTTFLPKSQIETFITFGD